MKSTKCFSFTPTSIIFSLLLTVMAFSFNGCKKEEINPRKDFIGSYQINSDNCRGSAYSLTILESGQQIEKIIIKNLNNVSGLSLTAVITGSSFVVDNTSYNGQAITGTGQLNGNVLTINYTVDGFPCTANGNKQ